MRNLLKSGLKRLVTSPIVTRPVGDRRARVLAVAAQKGGVGKTTTSVNLGCALARFHGLRVLIVDLDPQGHVATSLTALTPSGGGSLAKVLTDPACTGEVMDIAVTTSIDGLDITPLDPALAAAEDLLSTRIGKEFLLRDALKITRTHYDTILLDCPPNQGNLTLNGLCAADAVVIPCDPSPLAVQGVESLVGTIGAVAARLHPELGVLGVLLTRVDGRNRALNQAIEQDIQGRFGDALLDTRIGIASGLARAQHVGVDIFAHQPDGRAAQQYRALASEVLAALNPVDAPAAVAR